MISVRRRTAHSTCACHSTPTPLRSLLTDNERCVTSSNMVIEDTLELFMLTGRLGYDFHVVHLQNITHRFKTFWATQRCIKRTSAMFISPITDNCSFFLR